MEVKGLNINKNREARIIRTANQRNEDAASLPDIMPMVGEIWQKGETAFLFADTGIGKSIAAIQIADRLSRGKSFLPMLKNECEPQRVLYYDYELSDRQFFKRYSDQENIHQFSDNFFIDNVDFAELYDRFPGRSFTEMLFEQIREDLANTKATVLIVDNISYLHTQTTQDQQASLDIMRFLTTLKKELQLSILVLAHTPKKSEFSPITMSDMSGSKHLPNFADSVFCIGKCSRDNRNRYIKQIKPSRSAEMVYDQFNVIELQIEKKNTFLGFEFVGFNNELELLNIADKQDPRLLAIHLKKTDPSLSVRAIAQKIGASKSAVQNWINDSTHNS
ncbi:AAA family ATPase [uncultured Draconibacterium sp.]|uniref:AAA family ATPase n=1 Tax=uncultured Draconibacterium sp. TaxID=1573823 RepID=UPI0025D721E5|nr:AAA family ATPase [uncultured Draconibacterium sp.]